MLGLERKRLRQLAAVVVMCCAFAASAQAPFPKDFFRFKKIINPEPSYYPELSANEFATLVPGAVFYPFILDAWPHRPLTNEEYFSCDSPEYVPDASVRLQSYIFEHSRNPLERSHTLSYLAKSRSRTAGPLVIKAFPHEQDIDTAADFLYALLLTEAKVPVELLNKYLGADNKRARVYAVKLYARQDYADPARLLRLAAIEPAPVVRREMHLAAARNAAKSRFRDWERFLADGDARALALAVPALFSFSEINARLAELVRRCRGRGPLVKFAIAKHCRPGLASKFNETLLAILATDKLSSVRAETATAIGRVKLPALHPQLLSLAQDPRPNVRLRAARSLRHFPVKDSFTRLVILTGDSFSPLTRIAARESLLAFAGAFPVEEQLRPHIDDAKQDIRYNTCLVLAALGSKRYAQQVEARVKKETRPINIAACIRLLIVARANPAEKTILSFAKHESPLVRTAMAEAVGALDLKQGYEIIKNYSLTDKKAPVRGAAEIALGVIADDSFAPTLLTILLRTDYRSMTNPEILQAQDRANACWSLSRLQTLGPATSKRLKALITERVIKIPMFPPVFDSNSVRVSACWTLATVGKRHRDRKILKLADDMIKVLAQPDDRLASMNQPPTGPALRSYAYQTRQFLDGKPAKRHILKINAFRFNLRKAKKPRTPLY